MKSFSPLIYVGHHSCSSRGSRRGNSRGAGHSALPRGRGGAGRGRRRHVRCGKHLRKLLLQPSQVLRGDGRGPETLNGGVVGAQHGVVHGRVDARRQHDALGEGHHGWAADRGLARGGGMVHRRVHRAAVACQVAVQHCGEMGGKLCEKSFGQYLIIVKVTFLHPFSNRTLYNIVGNAEKMV